MAENNESKTAYFAGGCFWCITPAFAETEGVLSVTAGYCGGDETDPGYEAVKQQRTGHRETVAILYDPAKVTYRTLLDVYLKNVDPLDATGQFIDKGRSYTLAVSSLLDRLLQIGERFIRRISGRCRRNSSIFVG